MKIHNVGQEDSYALAVKALRSEDETATEDNGELMLLTDNLSGDGCYGAYQNFEIIVKSDGSYIIWNIGENGAERYTYNLSRTNGWNSGQLALSTGTESRWALELPVDFFKVTWHVVEGDDRKIVATETVDVEEKTLLTLNDLPQSLRRHFCEYNSMHEGTDDGTYATLSTDITTTGYTTTAAKTIYVPYTLDDGAPEFTTASAVSTSLENKYWYEMHFPLLANHSPSLDTYLYNNGDGSSPALTYESTSNKTLDVIRNDSGTKPYQNYCWALVGTPYGVQFYNRATGKYLTYDGSTFAVSGDAGTTFDLLDDYTGDLCAIYDEATGIYVNRFANAVTTNATAYTSCEFTNTNGLVKLTFILHYSPNTLRTSDGTLSGTQKASTTEDIAIRTYQKQGKSLDKVLPNKWKRAFCDYTNYWNFSNSSDSRPTETVSNVTSDMVEKYQSSSTDIYVHVTYDYEAKSPFRWSANDTGNRSDDLTGKYWYYCRDHHHEGGRLRSNGEGALLRQVALTSQQFTSNYEWCVMGDPYGFRMRCGYDPDQECNEYLCVSTDTHAQLTDCNHVKLISTADGSDGETSDSRKQNLFEMRMGSWEDYFWIHPIYTADLMAEDDNFEDDDDTNDVYHYMRADGLASAHPILATAKNIAGNSVANYALIELTNMELEEYLYFKGFVGALSNDVVKNATGLNFVIGGTTYTTLTDIFNALKDYRSNIKDYSNYTPFITNEVAEYIHSLLGTGTVQMKQGYYRIIPYTYEKYQQGTGETGGRHYMRGYLYGPGTGDLVKTVTEGYGATDTKWTDYDDGAGIHKSLILNETLERAAYDPASIFLFESATDVNGHPRFKVSTQGMYLNTTSNHSAAQMYNTDSPYLCRYENLGSGIMQLKVGDSTNDYLAYVQNWQDNTYSVYQEDVSTRRAALRSSLAQNWSYTSDFFTRLYLQPVGSEDENMMPLKLQVYPGDYTERGDSRKQYLFATICVPYDLLIEDENVNAYLGRRVRAKDGGNKDYNVTEADKKPDWRLQCELVPENGSYAAGKFIPAGTPVLIRATSAKQESSYTGDNYDRQDEKAYYVKFSLPNDAPSTAIDPTENYFKGSYLEQVLSGTDLPGAGEQVYVFGRATDTDYTTAKADEVGFYPNKNTTNGQTDGTANNNYVRHNKVYIFGPSTSAGLAEGQVSAEDGNGARRRITITFKDDPEGQEFNFTLTPAQGTYDLQGRRVSDDDRELPTGVYIRNGKKVMIKRQK